MFKHLKIVFIVLSILLMSSTVIQAHRLPLQVKAAAQYEIEQNAVTHVGLRPGYTFYPGNNCANFASQIMTFSSCGMATMQQIQGDDDWLYSHWYGSPENPSMSSGFAEQDIRNSFKPSAYYSEILFDVPRWQPSASSLGVWLLNSAFITCKELDEPGMGKGYCDYIAYDFDSYPVPTDPWTLEPWDRCISFHQFETIAEPGDILVVVWYEVDKKNVFQWKEKWHVYIVYEDEIDDNGDPYESPVLRLAAHTKHRGPGILDKHGNENGLLLSTNLPNPSYIYRILYKQQAWDSHYPRLDEIGGE